MTDIQSISDANGNPVGVIVPIEIWREIEAEQETAYLTKSETMKSVCWKQSSAARLTAASG